MSNWDGQGLPPQAIARLSRVRDSHIASSLLSIAGQAGLDACGFAPVSEVMGCVVEHIGWQGYGGCGWGYGSYAPTSTVTQSTRGYFGFGPFLDALNAGWSGALERMLTECRSLGADGVVGVTVEEQNLGDGNHEFLALGTAVRSLGATHIDRPFSTTLSGQDLAKLLHGGWTPVAVIVPIAVGIRHDDYQTVQATFRFSGNQEVPGYSELVHAVRAECRRELGRRSAAYGAEGSIITTAMQLHVHELEVGEGHRDHVGQASLVATAIARCGPVRSPAGVVSTSVERQTRGEEMTEDSEALALGVPEDAMRRLAEMRPGQPGALFTSDLTVNEFLLVREAAFHPVGLVLGSSIYHVGLQIGRWSKNMELDTLSQAMYHARELAMTRMEAEADALGADGIVGVRLEIEFKEFGNDLAEFIAIGTAVKAEEGNWRNNEGKPFTSDLSGQDFWTLIQAGYAPLGMVMGNCVYHIAHQRGLAALGNVGRNVEIPQFTEALYDARELAMSRMQAEAEQLSAEGIVGVQLLSLPHRWGGHTTEFFAIGTAVRPLRADHTIARPQLVLPLTD